MGIRRRPWIEVLVVSRNHRAQALAKDIRSIHGATKEADARPATGLPTSLVLRWGRIDGG